MRACCLQAGRPSVAGWVPGIWQPGAQAIWQKVNLNENEFRDHAPHLFSLCDPCHFVCNGLAALDRPDPGPTRRRPALWRGGCSDNPLPLRSSAWAGHACALSGATSSRTIRANGTMPMEAQVNAEIAAGREVVGLVSTRRPGRAKTATRRACRTGWNCLPKIRKTSGPRFSAGWSPNTPGA